MYKLRIKMLLAACLLILFSKSLHGQYPPSFADGHSLARQLQMIVNFASAQKSETDKSNEVIRRFTNSLKQPDKTIDHPGFADDFADFIQLAFDSSAENSSAVFRTLQICGRAQFFRIPEKAIPCEKHFSRHVKEAILINKNRSAYYSAVSQGKSQSLTRMYLALEYAILPVAGIMDLWARKYQKQGLPVLVNDFVTMDSVAAPEQQLVRNGALDQNGIKSFKTILKNYNKNASQASRKKDFAMVQFYAIKALSDLRHLEKAKNCNLSMSIHLIESAGLAARNASLLSKTYNRQTDDFYRVFIILQNLGLKSFAKLDLLAHKFHQAGIGIITNDLPAIPFP